MILSIGGLASIISPANSSEKEGCQLKTIDLTTAQWRVKLSAKQYDILRDQDTEAPFSHPFNDEKRVGIYACAGCDLDLFTSATKYDSGTGWPSFYAAIDCHIETRLDFYLILPRTEYHCARCGGHQGHIFNDGPKPSGKRYCNNGLALTFKPQINS